MVPDGSAPSRARPRDVRRRSFEPLYREHYAFVWRCLLGFGVRDDTEDAVQEVFVTAYRRMHTYEGRGSMQGWLAGIARRVASRWRRTAERRHRRHSAVETPDDVEDLEAWLRRKEAQVFLDRFLDGLDVDRRRVFVLCDLEGLRGREAAEALGVNQNTAYARLRSARASFEQACARLEQDGAAITAAQLRDARGEPPSEQRVNRAWAAFALQTGLASAGKGVAAAATIPLWTSVKVAAMTVVVGGVGLGAVRLALPDAEPESTAVVAASVASTDDAPPPERAPESARAKPAEPESAPVLPEPPPSPVASIVAASPKPSSTSTPVKRRPTKARTPPAAAKPSDDGLSGAELEQLGRAHRAYAAGRYVDAARHAAQLLQAHPDGEIASDARVVLVKAECSRGRVEAAKRAARALRGDEAARLLATHCEKKE